MSRAVRILFAVNSEAGQLNPHLAVIHSLLEHHHDQVELHLCSFSPAKKRCPGGVRFHPLKGMSEVDVLKHDGWEETAQVVRHVSSFLGVLNRVRRISYICSPHTTAQYFTDVHHIEQLLDEIKPDLLVIDTILPQAWDAAKRLGYAYICISPNAWKDNAGFSQQLNIFTWPAMGLGWSYPLPIYLIPLNIIALLSFGLSFALSPFNRAKNAARREAGYTWSLLPDETDTRLCVGVPALEYPGVNPSTLYPVGPVYLPSPPLAGLDEPLNDWLERDHETYTTIMFALGTHFRLTLSQAENLLGMFDELLTSRNDIRIYAKVMRKGVYELPLAEQLETKWAGRLKIVEWMEVDPVVVLSTGRIGLAIHHGGSNSYHEALSLGIPQVIVAAWFDCYDFATRIESLGVGKWGNRKAAPGFDTSELLNSIYAVLGNSPTDTTYAHILSRAKECAAVVENTARDLKGHDGKELIVQGKDKGRVVGRDVAGEWIFRKAMSLIA